jgi:hypothetical protein
VQTADRVFFQITGRNHTFDKAMQKELEQHGKWHQEFKRLRYRAPTAHTPAANAGKGDNSGDGKKPEGKRSGDKFCLIHQHCGHTTDECKEVAKRLQGEAPSKKGGKAAKADPVAVTTPLPGSDQVAMGMNPTPLWPRLRPRHNTRPRTEGRVRMATRSSMPSARSALPSLATSRSTALGVATLMVLLPSLTSGNHVTRRSAACEQAAQGEGSDPSHPLDATGRSSSCRAGGPSHRGGPNPSSQRTHR